MTLSPSMFRRWKSNTGQHVDDFAACCSAAGPTSRPTSARTAVATANSEKKWSFPVPDAGDISLPHCEGQRSAISRRSPPRRGDRLTRLARPPATIDRHDVSGNVRGAIRAGKDYDLRDLHRRAPTTERNYGQYRRLRFRRQRPDACPKQTKAVGMAAMSNTTQADRITARSGHAAIWLARAPRSP